MSWVQSTLGEVADIFSGYAFKSADMNSEGGTPLIKIKNIADSAVSHECDAFLNKDFNLAKFERFHLLCDDFLVAMTGQGSVGRIGKMRDYKPGFYVNQRVAIVRVNPEKANPVFIFYQIATRSNELELFKKANGAGQPNISAKQIGELPVVLPSTEQQQYIADVLSSYDDLIENNQKQIKLLEEAAQRLYKEWFVDLRFPSHETTPIVDGVPEGWEQNTINSIIDLQSGFAFKSADFCDSGKYKIVTIKNVQDGLFEGQNVSRIDDIPARMPAHCRLGDGDILLSLTGNVGRVCVVNGQNYLLNQRVAKIKSDYTAYAYCLFRSSDMFTAMGNLANGAAQQNLSPIKTGQIRILIPPVDLLVRFEVAVSVYMKQMLNLNKQIELLQQARDRLLPKLMSGEIEV